MPGLKTRRDGAPGGPFRFRISDAMAVPHRGWVLRLRLVDGQPSAKDLKPGAWVRLETPAGSVREVPVKANGTTSGVLTQKRLDREREVDLVLEAEHASVGAAPAEIGWYVAGPVSAYHED